VSNLFFEFQKMIKGKRPEEGLLVPLLIWASGSEKNIEVCQNINRKFFGGNRQIYIGELTLGNSISHVIRYPKIAKKDEKFAFFYEDMCKYFEWSSRELEKNMSILDIDDIKIRLASAFGYGNKERKILGLERINYGKKKRKTNTG